MALIFQLTADISKIYKFCPYKMYGGKEKISRVFPFYITGLESYYRTGEIVSGIGKLYHGIKKAVWVTVSWKIRCKNPIKRDFS
jgi:hypothetical protein